MRSIKVSDIIKPRVVVSLTDENMTLEEFIETHIGFEIIDEKDTISDMQKYAREQRIKKQENMK